VDEGVSLESFIAVPGEITANSNTIEVSNPTNDVKSNIYNLKFTLESEIPKAGYIQVNFPEEIRLQVSSTLSTGSCKVYTCMNNYATESGVRFLIADGQAKGSEVNLEIGGVTNPRSFKPSGDIVVTSFDTDGESKIDVGYKNKAEMTIAGPVTSFSVSQTNFTNGDINIHTFAVQALIPLVVGDKFTMTLPQEMDAPADVATMDC
jgi:hypothetical protein